MYDIYRSRVGVLYRRDLNEDFSGMDVHDIYDPLDIQDFHDYLEARTIGGKFTMWFKKV